MGNHSDVDRLPGESITRLRLYRQHKLAWGARYKLRPIFPTPSINRPRTMSVVMGDISFRGLLALASLFLTFVNGGVYATETSQSSGICETTKYENKSRVFIMTDISNEPDDQMSLVRFLTYSNELDIINIAAVTSTWKNNSIDTPTIFGVIDSYSKVVDNLNNNVPAAGEYPPGDEIAAKVVTGHPVYGLAALNEPSPSNASTALIAGVDASDEPLWVTAWGGANVLAEALKQVQNERNEKEVAAFVRRLRVYSISDQDDAGAWIRMNFPTLFYIVSVHGFSEYALASWNVCQLWCDPYFAEIC